ncbi:uncharacterized protein LOC143907531 [Temnothorax americanus]|uniref:uncharacterized protein LOC143907531 n=1 Tax=Temnothorax americanus TaxID=1964332 RepID=UPI0040683A3B
MERKCQRNPRFGELYRQFMREYEELKHMRLAPVFPGESECYLPHHGVLQESSTSTKLRVVFNGSQQTTSGELLNHHFLVGANLLPALVDVLIRWRWHRYAFVTDIEKMYRQILIHPDDRKYQCILWRCTLFALVCVYQLLTVTYGLACALFLAIRTLRQLAHDEQSRYPQGAITLRENTFVDDVVSGANTLSDAIAKQTKLCGLCTAGGFPLRKWAANDEEMLSGIPPKHRLYHEPHSWENDSFSTLGLLWHPNEDTFAFTIHPRTVTELTKRRVLSETARFFDPLGWLAPVVIRAKILIQSAWLQKLDWDDLLPAAGAHC